MIMRQFLGGNRTPRFPRHGLQDRVGQAVHAGSKAFVVRAPADPQIGDPWPPFPQQRVGRGERDGAGGGAIRHKCRVCGDVGDQGVEGGGWVRKDARGGEGLRRASTAEKASAAAASLSTPGEELR